MFLPCDIPVLVKALYNPFAFTFLFYFSFCPRSFFALLSSALFFSVNPSFLCFIPLYNSPAPSVSFFDSLQISFSLSFQLSLVYLKRSLISPMTLLFLIPDPLGRSSFLLVLSLQPRLPPTSLLLFQENPTPSSRSVFDARNR